MERSEQASSNVLAGFPHQWINGILVVDYPARIGPDLTPERLEQVKKFSEMTRGLARKMNVTVMCNGKPFMEH